MRTIISRFAIVILFSALISCGSNPEKGFLKTSGQDFTDAQGNKIFLKSVGLGNWLLPEGYMWKFGKDGDRPRKIEKIVSDLAGEEFAEKFWKEFRANYITEKDLKRIAELGFNTVRPALNSRLFITEGETGQFIDEGFQLIDNLIDWCGKYNIYVVIDIHGAPGGQTGANIDDSPNDEPELFIHEYNKDNLERLWVKIAERYKDNTTVIAYNLINEPLPEVTGAADKYKDQLIPLYKRLIAAIRKVDKNHMFTVEGYNWANNWSLFDKPLDDNVFYQFHYYCWDKPDNLKSVQYYIDKRDSLNTPIWVGETGEKGNTIYWGTTDYFETENIGWSFWPWKKMQTVNTPYSIKRPELWDSIAGYSNGEAACSKATAQAAFYELLNNIKLENCEFYPDVVNSIFRRLPNKVEAENYGHEGYGISYFVKDTSARAQAYRYTELVPIELIDYKKSDWHSQQGIILTSGEWTEYEINNPVETPLHGNIRVKALTGGKLVFSTNGKNYEFEIPEGDWQNFEISSVDFKPGKNKYRLSVEKGKLFIDWIDFQ